MELQPFSESISTGNTEIFASKEIGRKTTQFVIRELGKIHPNQFLQPIKGARSIAEPLIKPIHSSVREIEKTFSSSKWLSQVKGAVKTLTDAKISNLKVPKATYTQAEKTLIKFLSSSVAGQVSPEGRKAFKGLLAKPISDSTAEKIGIKAAEKLITKKAPALTVLKFAKKLIPFVHILAYVYAVRYFFSKKGEYYHKDVGWY